jgi:hypothetical protein
MRVLVIATSLAVLSACGPAPKEQPAAEETVAAEPAAMTSANGSVAGTYIITGPDGSESTSTINADGTYTSPAADGSVVEGTWAVVDGKTCFTTKEEGAKPECWTEAAPGEDGSFTATSDAGATVTVRPAPAAAPAAEGAEPAAAE